MIKANNRQSTNGYFKKNKRALHLYISLFMVAIMAFSVASCSPQDIINPDSDKQSQTDTLQSFEAILLKESSVLVTETQTQLVGKYDLVSLSFSDAYDGEKLKPGSLYSFSIEDQTLDSWPVLATVISAQKIKDRVGPTIISFDTTASIMSHLPTESAHLIDVRTVAEFEAGYIPGAKNLPLDRLSDLILDEVPDKEDIIILYCQSGNRTKQASAILNDLGYQLILDAGGIRDYGGQLD